MEKNRVVVITGGSAGVGRATAREFARAGWNIGLIARGQERLTDAVAELRAMGRQACGVAADVADAGAIEEAAAAIERTLGPIDVWVNNAMATVFGAVHTLDAAEIRRGTEVTYLGQVHGTMAALRRMRPRNRGTIINVGSALAYRAIPLQSVYCAAKYAVRGFTDALRSELLHDKLRVHLCMVHLSAMNTPQFDWARNHTGRRTQPVPPIFEPEVAARAICFAATHRRREIWVGFPAVKAILANRVAPGLIDHILARQGYSGQLTAQPESPRTPGNLFAPAPGHQEARGRFSAVATRVSLFTVTDRHRTALSLGLLALAGFAAQRAAARR